MEVDRQQQDQPNTDEGEEEVTSDGQNSDISLRYYGIDLSILPEDATNQILHSVYVRAYIIYSNIDFKIAFKKLQKNSLTSLFPFFLKIAPLVRITNDQDVIAVLGLKKYHGAGKILVISSLVYTKSIFIREENLILSNFNDQNGKVTKHPVIRGLVKRNTTNLVIHINQKDLKQQKLQQNIDVNVLQSNQSSIYLNVDAVIVEKYLAPKQKFYVNQLQRIICISEEIQVKLENIASQNPISELEGPGWVFIQNICQEKIKNNFRTIGIFFMFLVFFTLFQIFMP